MAPTQQETTELSQEMQTVIINTLMRIKSPGRIAHGNTQ